MGEGGSRKTSGLFKQKGEEKKHKAVASPLTSTANDVSLRPFMSLANLSPNGASYIAVHQQRRPNPVTSTPIYISVQQYDVGTFTFL